MKRKVIDAQHIKKLIEQKQEQMGCDEDCETSQECPWTQLKKELKL